MKKPNVRLPQHVVPTHYTLTLKPDLDQFSFAGDEAIEVEVKKSTKEVVLHADELVVLNATFRSGKIRISSSRISYNKKKETVTLVFPKVLPKGRGTVDIVFTGILNDKMRGFYRSKYEVDGKIHHMATTQFESTDARRAFPCIDEPAVKATFTVKLIIPQELTAISNTLEQEVAEHESGYKIVTFSPTPKMSTYLLAFLVGRFEHIQTTTKEGTLVRVFVTPGKKKQAEFALEVAAKTMSFFSDYFKIPYPLPVIDLIAIPDFAAGAMENWGAVTYRETALLVDEDHSSTVNKQWVALVIAHELAHQWFGDLVTMEWWTHLWLNEGFASYIEYLAVDKIFPNWHIWTQFVYMDHARALELDSLENTHPIEVEVHHPGEISEIFDAVSYSKGASIIRMLAEHLGEDNFRRGLQQYLKKHSYANAATTDLWNALEKVSKKPVSKIMKNWTGKPGYPLIAVSQKNNTLVLSQKRYFASVISAKKSKDKTIWSVPISILDSSLRKKDYLLTTKTLSISASKNGWIKLNGRETAFLRVLYSKELLEQLKNPIIEKKLSEEDRYGIVRDMFNLAQSGYGSSDEALHMLSAFKKEDSYVVWAEIATRLSVLHNLLADLPIISAYEKFCQSVFGDMAKKVGWDKRPGESHFQTLLRSAVLYSIGTYGHTDTIKKAQQIFNNGKATEKIHSDIRGAVYSLVAENGGKKEYEWFMKAYKTSSFQEEKDRLMRALCRFKQKDLLEKTLAFSFSEDVRAQDSFKVVSMIFHNIYGRELAWDFVKRNWKTILERFGGGGHLLTRFIQSADTFTSRQYAKEVSQFFKKNPYEGITRTVAQVVEQIESNDAWLSRDKVKIEQFLKKS